MSRRPSLLRTLFAAAAGALLVMGISLGAAEARQDCKRPAGSKVHTPKIVNFAFDSSEIDAKFQAELTQIAERFAGNPNIEICLVGMTDRSGNADYNKKLALRRANAVADLLKAKGLATNKFQIVSRGQAYGDDSWVGKIFGDKPSESNRRVDVLLMER